RPPVAAHSDSRAPAQPAVLARRHGRRALRQRHGGGEPLRHHRRRAVRSREPQGEPRDVLRGAVLPAGSCDSHGAGILERVAAVLGRVPRAARHDAYFSVTNGFKAGGFNPASPAGGESYGEEHTWNYEGGVKTAFAGGRASATMSVFSIDWQ